MYTLKGVRLELQLMSKIGGRGVLIMEVIVLLFMYSFNYIGV